MALTEPMPVTEPKPRKTWPRVRKTLPGESKTKQADKDACDINALVARSIKSGGVIPDARLKYGDFANGEDFQGALDRILEAQRLFSELPSSIRKRMNNNPAELLEFLGDPANVEEAVALGLLDFTPDEPAPGEPEPAAPEGSPPAGGEPPTPPT